MTVVRAFDRIRGMASFCEVDDRPRAAVVTQLRRGVTKRALMCSVHDVVDVLLVVRSGDHGHPLPVALVLIADAFRPRCSAQAAQSRDRTDEVVEAQKPPVVDVEAVIRFGDVIVDRRFLTSVAVEQWTAATWT